MRTMNNSVTPKFSSLSVPNRGKKGHEKKCASSAGRAENVTKKRGEGRKMRRNW
jgi:hypothetical protein